MTKRGTLAYYLVALVAGPFFMVACTFLYVAFTQPEKGFGGISGFVLAYVLGLVGGGLTALIQAALLRTLGKRFGGNSPWRWIGLGGAISFALVWLIAKGWMLVIGERRVPKSLFEILLIGPVAVSFQGVWLAIPAGMATGYLLFKVHKRFAATYPAEPETGK